jgi:hypothetical protein
MQRLFSLALYLYISSYAHIPTCFGSFAILMYLFLLKLLHCPSTLILEVLMHECNRILKYNILSYDGFQICVVLNGFQSYKTQ